MSVAQPLELANQSRVASGFSRKIHAAALFRLKAEATRSQYLEICSQRMMARIEQIDT